MNKQKTCALLTITFLLLSSIVLLVPTAQASTAVIYQYNTTPTATSSLRDVHPSDSAYASEVGISFIATSTGYVRIISFQLLKTGSPVGSLIPMLYTSSGSTTGDTAVPNVQLEIGEIYDASLIPATAAWINFYFSGDTQLTAGQTYSVGLRITGATIDTSNYVKIEQTGSSIANQTGYSFANGVYTAADTLNILVNVQGDTEPNTTPTPTPSPTPIQDYKWDENTNSWSWWNGTHWIPSSGPSPTANAQIVTFTGNMITYIVPLALLLLPAVVGAWALGRAGAAKWGFIAGLNIGAIMCYLYLPAFGLWAVIAIVMVDVLMIFASTRGGD